MGGQSDVITNKQTDSKTGSQTFVKQSVYLSDNPNVNLQDILVTGKGLKGRKRKKKKRESNMNV